MIEFDPTNFEPEDAFFSDFCEEANHFLCGEMQKVRKRLQGNLTKEEHDHCLELYALLVIATKQVAKKVII